MSNFAAVYDTFGKSVKMTSILHVAFFVANAPKVEIQRKYVAGVPLQRVAASYQRISRGGKIVQVTFITLS